MNTWNYTSLFLIHLHDMAHNEAHG
jgi:hypothetical protein